MEITNSEKTILRELARKTKEIASLSAQEAKRNNWIAHNSLKKSKPLILRYPGGAWPECIITPDQQKCQNEIARDWEQKLLICKFNNQWRN